MSHGRVEPTRGIQSSSTRCRNCKDPRVYALYSAAQVPLCRDCFHRVQRHGATLRHATHCICEGYADLNNFCAHCHRTGNCITCGGKLSRDKEFAINAALSRHYNQSTRGGKQRDLPSYLQTVTSAITHPAAKRMFNFVVCDNESADKFYSIPVPHHKKSYNKDRRAWQRFLFNTYLVFSPLREKVRHLRGVQAGLGAFDELPSLPDFSHVPDLDRRRRFTTLAMTRYHGKMIKIINQYAGRPLTWRVPVYIIEYFFRNLFPLEGKTADILKYNPLRFPSQPLDEHATFDAHVFHAAYRLWSLYRMQGIDAVRKQLFAMDSICRRSTLIARNNIDYHDDVDENGDPIPRYHLTRATRLIARLSGNSLVELAEAAKAIRYSARKIRRSRDGGEVLTTPTDYSNTRCRDCGHVFEGTRDECPKCHFPNPQVTRESFKRGSIKKVGSIRIPNRERDNPGTRVVLPPPTHPSPNDVSLNDVSPKSPISDDDIADMEAFAEAFAVFAPALVPGAAASSTETDAGSSPGADASTADDTADNAAAK